jgi:hypothetical protein
MTTPQLWVFCLHPASAGRKMDKHLSLHWALFKIKWDKITQPIE